MLGIFLSLFSGFATYHYVSQGYDPIIVVGCVVALSSLIYIPTYLAQIKEK